MILYACYNEIKWVSTYGFGGSDMRSLFRYNRQVSVLSGLTILIIVSFAMPFSSRPLASIPVIAAPLKNVAHALLLTDPENATLVKKTSLNLPNTPIPDPTGIAYIPDAGTLLIS